jgi:hypothetical protein
LSNAIRDERPRGQQQTVVAQAEARSLSFGNVVHLARNWRGSQIPEWVQLKRELQTQAVLGDHACDVS